MDEPPPGYEKTISDIAENVTDNHDFTNETYPVRKRPGTGGPQRGSNDAIYDIPAQGGETSVSGF